MDLTVNITVAYECKVAETGYKIDEDDNLVPVHQSTRYVSKPFSIECIREFNTLFPVGQGKSPQEEAHAKRIAFANNWGVFREEGEGYITTVDIALFFAEIEKGKQLGKIPKVKGDVTLSWKYGADGKLAPLIEANSLYEAMKIAWHFNPEYEVAKSCLYFVTYGERTNCQKSFIPKRSDARFCSVACRDHYNKKHTRAVMKSAVAGVKAGMQAQAKAMKNRKSLFKNIPIKTDGADD